MPNYPTTIYSPRVKANRPGITYDPDNKYAGYAEDITNLDAEVVAIETDLKDTVKPSLATIVANFSSAIVINPGHLHSSLSASDGTPSQAVYVDAAGNVGIGTTNPIVSFQVNGNWISGNDTVLPNMSGGMTAGNIFHNFNNYGGLLIKKISTGTGDYFEIQDSSANSLMVVKSSGNVGIGTASPQAKLDVNGIASSTTFYAGNGTAANPSYSFSNYHGTGFSTNGAILMSVGGAQVGGFGSAGFTAAGFGIQSATDPLAGGVGLGSSGVINWQATYPTKDIGLSRGAAGKLYVGNGTQGDYTGTLIAGNVGIGTTSPSAKLDVNADTFRIRTAKTPATAGATGNAGDHCWDANYFYVCVATNTWVRAALSTW